MGGGLIGYDSRRIEKSEKEERDKGKKTHRKMRIKKCTTGEILMKSAKCRFVKRRKGGAAHTSSFHINLLRLQLT